MRLVSPKIGDYILDQPSNLVNLWDMLSHYASHYIWVLEFLKITQEIELEETDDQKKKALFRNITTEAIKRIGLLDMPMSELQCSRIIQILGDSKQLDLSELRIKYNELAQRIEDELQSKQFFHVETSLVGFYDNNQFQEEIVNRFSVAIYDMEESGKCFALGRHTACAFHLLRVIEAGIISLKESVGSQKTTHTWMDVIKILDEYAKKSAEKGKRTKIQEIISRLYAIKDAWRNPTMHVVMRYGKEEAKEVFDATKNFMANLCNYLDSDS